MFLHVTAPGMIKCLYNAYIMLQKAPPLNKKKKKPIITVNIHLLWTLTSSTHSFQCHHMDHPQQCVKFFELSVVSPPSRPARQSAPKVASDKCCQDKQSWGGKGRREQHDSTNNTKMKNAEHRWHQRWLGICGQKPGVTPSGKQKTKSFC